MRRQLQLSARSKAGLRIFDLRFSIAPPDMLKSKI